MIVVADAGVPRWCELKPVHFSIRRPLHSCQTGTILVVALGS
jgi:hypothetical protein